MSMDHDTYGVCDCGNQAFEPVRCAVCEAEAGHRSQTPKLCTDCRHECPECKEAVCEDHWRGRQCMACERAEGIAAGEHKVNYGAY